MGGLSVQWNTVRVDSADEIQWKNSVEMLWVGDFSAEMDVSSLCHECVHHHIMAQTSAHDKQVENLM